MHHSKQSDCNQNKPFKFVAGGTDQDFSRKGYSLITSVSIRRFPALGEDIFLLFNYIMRLIFLIPAGICSRFSKYNTSLAQASTFQRYATSHHKPSFTFNANSLATIFWRHISCDACFVLIQCHSFGNSRIKFAILIKINKFDGKKIKKMSLSRCSS